VSPANYYEYKSWQNKIGRVTFSENVKISLSKGVFADSRGGFVSQISIVSKNKQNQLLNWRKSVV
jgi:hypothetical protein